LFVAAFLTGYNFMSPWRSGIGYVVANMVTTSALAAAVVVGLHMTLKEIGIRGNRWSAAAKVAVAAVALTAPLYVFASADTTAPLVADERVAGLDDSQVAFNMLVRIPLGTALAEELAFRGVLFGMFRPSGLATATLVSSSAFGLWHIHPAMASIRANFPETGEPMMALLVLSALGITGVAGAGFCWLREKTGGIAAPWALHATLNSLALGAAALAHGQ
jgi:membrane protease YdiL (CAAX protease family)